MDSLKGVLALVIISLLTLPSEGNREQRVTRTALCDSSRVSGHTWADYSPEHVNNLKRDLLRDILHFWDIIRLTNDAWIAGNGNVPFPEEGLHELNPTTQQIASFTNVNPRAAGRTRRYEHVVLREIRWFLTAIDTACQLTHHAGQLGPLSDSLVSLIAGLSARFDDFVKLFGVPLDDLPAQANCREMNTITADSFTLRIQFTSLALRDVFNALIRIHDVLDRCDVRGTHGVGHGLHLYCPNDTTFYSQLPFGYGNGNEVLIPMEHFVNYSVEG